jgi:single-stranded-DNA-specific exonuclease
MTTRVQETPGAVVPATIVKILAGRGMAPEDMAAFVFPHYDQGLHNPYDLLDMEKAVARLIAARDGGERVVVYGDYDIDGITASGVMLEALAANGIEATSYIPDRFEEGYGINQDALEKLKAAGSTLVVSVDCGITSVAEADWARSHGLDLIITDHHSVPEVIPEAVAVINPKRPGDLYPCKDLAGVGVAFKLAQALQTATGRPAAGQEKWWLDLVALGTVCDVVSLTGENRVLVSFGLRVLRRTKRVGLRSLAQVGGVDIARIKAHDLGYVLGPRMNAAGRLEHAAQSLELVMTQDGERAAHIASDLDLLNRQRRADQDRIFAAADEMAAQYAEDPVLVVADPGWSHGVVGIVASKLAEKWDKPVLVAQIIGDSIKGSARSRGAYNMVEALRANAPLLTKFGGHFFAAGYTLPVERLSDLRKGLCDYHRTSGAATASPPEEPAELRLDSLGEANWQLLSDLELLEPFGAGNRQPDLELVGVAVHGVSRIGSEGRHLRLRLSDQTGASVAGIAFGLGPLHANLKDGQIVNVRGQLNNNEYQGRSSLQLVIGKIAYE